MMNNFGGPGMGGMGMGPMGGPGMMGGMHGGMYGMGPGMMGGPMMPPRRRRRGLISMLLGGWMW